MFQYFTSENCMALLNALKKCERALSLDSDMEEDFAEELAEARAAIQAAEAEGN